MSAPTCYRCASAGRPGVPATTNTLGFDKVERDVCEPCKREHEAIVAAAASMRESAELQLGVRRPAS